MRRANHFETPDGVHHGVSLRSFEPATGLWAIWWLGETSRNALDIPVIGRFSNGVGTFQASDTFHGQPIIVRFTLSPVSGSPHYRPPETEIPMSNPNQNPLRSAGDQFGNPRSSFSASTQSLP